MKRIAIENYRVSTFFTQAQDGAFIQRMLELESTAGYRGFRYEIKLTFVKQNPWSNSVTGFLSNQPQGLSYLLQAWPNLGEFQTYYDILRNEKPVYFYFEPGRRNENITDIVKVGIGTTVEPPGEGPKDTSDSPFLDLVDLPFVVNINK